MFYQLKKSIANGRFDRQTRDILDTPPIEQKESPLSIVSMVENKDVQMYILAIKALYRRLKRGKIVAIIDSDMPQSSRKLIREHLGNVEFVLLDSIDTGSCQRGGTWERVLFCVDRSATDYVIQIDADVLCFGPIEEVLQCIEQNSAFTIAEGIPIQPLTNWVEKGIARGQDHIVTAFEVKALEFPDAARWLYVRGSSGFAGFARGGITRAVLEEFHAGGAKVHGARWTEWGTEQLASNFAVANSPRAVALPYPKYATWEPEYAAFQKNGITADMSALHFIGVFRFDLGVFPKLANREIGAMLTAPERAFAAG
jgi:uncharacterized protein YbaR (Trm112 family)